jgi:hypothetical protein
MERDAAACKLNRFSGERTFDAHLMFVDSTKGSFKSA